MHRYEESDESLTKTFLDIVEERFGSLQFLKFKLLYDTKKRIKQGKLILATVELPSPKIKFFSRDKIAVDGYDLLIIVDKKMWELANEVDRRRVFSHELRHVFLDEKGDVKLIGHEIEDFYVEIKLNGDDPEWQRKLGMLVSDIYEQEKQMLKDGKPKKKEK